MAASGQFLGDLMSAFSGTCPRKVCDKTSSAAENVGNLERVASFALGSALVVNGLKKRSLGGLITASGAAPLLMRAFSGHCALYSALGITSAASKAGNEESESKQRSTPVGFGRTSSGFESSRSTDDIPSNPQFGGKTFDVGSASSKLSDIP